MSPQPLERAKWGRGGRGPRMAAPPPAEQRGPEHRGPGCSSANLRETAAFPAREAARPAEGIPGLGRTVPSGLSPRPCPAPLLTSPRCKNTSDHLRK